MNLKNISNKWLIVGMGVSGAGLLVAIIAQYARLWKVFLCGYHNQSPNACTNDYQRDTYTTVHGLVFLALQFASLALLTICIVTYVNRRSKK